jgi:hypothetical protein
VAAAPKLLLLQMMKACHCLNFDEILDKDVYSLQRLHSTDPYHRHVFGQSAKKEHGINNLKVASSAWDMNMVSCSGMHTLLMSQ